MSGSTMAGGGCYACEVAYEAIATRFSVDNISNNVSETMDVVQDFLVDRYYHWKGHPGEYLAGFEDKANQFAEEWQLLAAASGGPPLAGPGFVTAGGGGFVRVSAAPGLVPPIFAAGNGEKNSTEEGTYKFPSSDGRWYVGQSNNILARLVQHIRSGKLLPENLVDVEVTFVPGGKTAREMAEQELIDSMGGVGNLRNVRNPMGPNR